MTLRIPTHRPPTHPGEMLREEFLLPLGIAAEEFAERIRVPAAVIEELLAERGTVTPDLALRLARALGTSAEFWLNGQMVWDLYHALRAPEAAEIEHVVPLPLNSSDDS
jgi:antitoxin HigA-1